MSKPKAGLFIVGGLTTSGKPQANAKSYRVVEFGDVLRDPFLGSTCAVKDSYGDWVSPTLKSVGLKSKMMLEWRGEDGNVTKRYPEGIADKHWTCSPEEV